MESLICEHRRCVYVKVGGIPHYGKFLPLPNLIVNRFLKNFLCMKNVNHGKFHNSGSILRSTQCERKGFNIPALHIKSFCSKNKLKL